MTRMTRRAPIRSALVRLSIDVSMNVAGRKIVGVDLDALQARPHLLDGVFDAPGDVERVRPRQLLDDEHQPGTVVDDGVAQERLVVDHDVGHVAQEEGLAEAVLDRHLGEVLRRDDREDVPDVEPLVRSVDESAGADLAGVRPADEASDVEVLGRLLLKRDQRDVVGAQPLRIGLHLVLVEALAPDRDVRHARHAQQPGPDLPVSDQGQVDERELVGGEPDLHDPARRREGLDHERRSRPARQSRRDGVEPLLHHLAGVHEVGPPLEEQSDVRELRNRLRANLLDARHSLKRLLQRNGDQRLDLFCREPEAGRLNLDSRLRELRENVYRCVAKRPTAEDHQRRRGSDDEIPKLQTRADDPAHHGVRSRPLSALRPRRCRARPRTARRLRRSRPRFPRVGPPRGRRDPPRSLGRLCAL